MAGIKAFSLDGIRYELLSDLISAFPIDYEKEKRLRIENELKEVKQEKKKVNHWQDILNFQVERLKKVKHQRKVLLVSLWKR